jgi:6-pyruvoyl-tetrahydropterin synthase
MSLSTSTPYASNYGTNFEVYVSKADFKFNAAHFVALKGFRERLHGHNYTLGVRLLGSRQISQDGYVLDFGDVKKVVKVICKRINERFLCPTKSDVIDMQIIASEDGKDVDPNDPKSKSVVLTCEDGAKFVIPYDDCAMLPIVHATVEELAIYMWGAILDGLDGDLLLRRGIHTMEIIMAEAPGQEAVFRLEIPKTKPGERFQLDVPSFIMSGEVDLSPTPCLNREEDTAVRMKVQEQVTPKHTGSSQCCEGCGLASFSKQLEALAVALNEKRPSGDELTGDDLRALLEKE